MAEQKHLGRIKLQPGQSLFCLDMKTGDITNMGRPRRVDVEEDITEGGAGQGSNQGGGTTGGELEG